MRPATPHCSGVKWRRWPPLPPHRLAQPDDGVRGYSPEASGIGRGAAACRSLRAGQYAEKA
jgi:hypothetical protein